MASFPTLPKRKGKRKEKKSKGKEKPKMAVIKRLQ
jgi:hypothetical protein